MPYMIQYVRIKEKLNVPKELSQVLRSMPTAEIEHRLGKTRQLTIRLSEHDKESIARAAAAFSLTQTEYLTKLHAWVIENHPGLNG